MMEDHRDYWHQYWVKYKELYKKCYALSLRETSNFNDTLAYTYEHKMHSLRASRIPQLQFPEEFGMLETKSFRRQTQFFEKYINNLSRVLMRNRITIHLK